MYLHKIFSTNLVLLVSLISHAQLNWKNVDSSYGPLPKGVHVYFSDQELEGKPFRAYYLVADLKNNQLLFTTDTTYKRRLTPRQFFEKNNQPVAVVNGTFFSFDTHQNLNLVMKDGKLVSYNVHSIAGRGKDTFTYRHPFASAIGISSSGKADVAWTYSDSLDSTPVAFQNQIPFLKDSAKHRKEAEILTLIKKEKKLKNSGYGLWKMHTAIGGGPVLVQNNKVHITNDEEMKFAGKAINDKHPRTAMGYTKNNELIILVIEGRSPIASGATLIQEAKILKELGCVEALNLDGGGSSCLLVNGKETIKPSGGVQRAVPAVFIIASKK